MSAADTVESIRAAIEQAHTVPVYNQIHVTVNEEDWAEVLAMDDPPRSLVTAPAAVFGCPVMTDYNLPRGTVTSHNQ